MGDVTPVTTMDHWPDRLCNAVVVDAQKGLQTQAHTLTPLMMERTHFTGSTQQL